MAIKSRGRKGFYPNIPYEVSGLRDPATISPQELQEMFDWIRDEKAADRKKGVLQRAAQHFNVPYTYLAYRFQKENKPKDSKITPPPSVIGKGDLVKIVELSPNISDKDIAVGDVGIVYYAGRRLNKTGDRTLWITTPKHPVQFPILKGELVKKGDSSSMRDTSSPPDPIPYEEEPPSVIDDTSAETKSPDDYAFNFELIELPPPGVFVQKSYFLENEELEVTISSSNTLRLVNHFVPELDSERPVLLKSGRYTKEELHRLQQVLETLLSLFDL